MIMSRNRTAAHTSCHVGIAVAIVLCSVILVHAQQEEQLSGPKAALVELSQEEVSSPGDPVVKSGTVESEQRETPAIASTQQGSRVQDSGNSSSAESNGAQVTPVGTAAAPSESTMGVAASRPAGAVIAPAKQRRVRSILIRVGLIVGAGVALGTVMAISHATPSRP